MIISKLKTYKVRQVGGYKDSLAWFPHVGLYKVKSVFFLLPQMRVYKVTLFSTKKFFPKKFFKQKVIFRKCVAIRSHFFSTRKFYSTFEKISEKVFLTGFLKGPNFCAKVGVQRMHGIGLICFGFDS